MDRSVSPNGSREDAPSATGGVWSRHGLRISGLGHYYPRQMIRNLEQARDPSPVKGNAVDQVVLGDIAVKSRHLSDEKETVAYMGARAAEKALRQAGRSSAEVDLLILANWTTRQFVPEVAPALASEVGAHQALAFDLCGACTGFVHGIQTAAAYLVGVPHWRLALVVCSEQFSRRVRPGSRGELVVGDAAGAAVLESNGRTDRGLVDSILYSDGRSAEVVTARAPNGWVKSKPEIVEQAIEANVRVVNRLLARNGLGIADIDWVVPHPGTDPIHLSIRRRLGLEEDRFVVNFDSRANTSSASIPIVLSEYMESGRFRRGDLFLTPAVGAGWFYGGLLFYL